MKISVILVTELMFPCTSPWYQGTLSLVKLVNMVALKIELENDSHALHNKKPVHLNALLY